MLYQVHLAWVGFDLTMSVVIGTDCLSSYKVINPTIIQSWPWCPPPPPQQYLKAMDTGSEPHITWRVHLYKVDVYFRRIILIKYNHISIGGSWEYFFFFIFHVDCMKMFTLSPGYTLRSSFVKAWMCRSQWCLIHILLHFLECFLRNWTTSVV